MKLDSRIMKRPFTPWDSKEFLQFIRSHDGKMTIPGYFANSFEAFCDLSNFADFDSAIGVLSAVMDNQDCNLEYPFSPGKDKWYQFFLPDEWVETSDVSETKGLKKEIEDLRETVKSLKSEINSLKGTIKTNSDRIHIIAQLQYGTPNPQANCSSEFVKQVLGVS